MKPKCENNQNRWCGFALRERTRSLLRKLHNHIRYTVDHTDQMNDRTDHGWMRWRGGAGLCLCPRCWSGGWTSIHTNQHLLTPRSISRPVGSEARDRGHLSDPSSGPSVLFLGMLNGFRLYNHRKDTRVVCFRLILTFFRVSIFKWDYFKRLKSLSNKLPGSLV